MNLSTRIVTFIIPANPLASDRRRQKQKDQFEQAEPKWNELPKISGVLFSYQMPNSFKTIVEGFPLKANRPIKATIQVLMNI